MSKKIPKFDERFFLLTILFDYRIEQGDDKDGFDNHVFDVSLDGRLANWFPDLVEEKAYRCNERLSIVRKRPYAIKWFEEAYHRGFVEKNKDGQFIFTPKGYKKALEHDANLFQRFFKYKWEVFTAKMIAIIVALSTVISTIFTVLNYFKE